MLAMEAIGASDCEALRDGLLAQPTNAVTSGAYVAAGIAVWLRIPVAQRFRWGGAYAVLLAMVGVGSVLYHGPQPVGSKFLHDAPIPLLLALIGLLIALRWRSAEVILPGATKRRVLALAGIGSAAGLSYLLGRGGAPLCDPDNWLQFHGLWHIATAAAFVITADLLFAGDPA